MANPSIEQTGPGKSRALPLMSNVGRSVVVLQVSQ